ncbi:MAG: cysteine desulfurase [Bryobacteraceae bacterium]|nr:cysteine desulfurase [Bryobacteraceae bacterium]MDW8378468.1 cysteine desulfurase family protein [Bryobacterales bacterium]
MPGRFYFDHNATTPLAGEVLEAFVSALRETPGNASSIHQFGQNARQKLEQARRQVANLLHAQAKEIVLVSGGTEANNLALLGSVQPGDHVITTAIEHPAVLNPCTRLQELGVEVTIVRPRSDGLVEPEEIRRALRKNTAFISVMHANNETGVIQPVEEISAIAHSAGARMHVDGVQAAGKITVDVQALGVDLYSVSAHKLYAPKGIGALYVRQGVSLRAQMFGGRQERGRRAGTENVPAAVAFGVAAQWAVEHGPQESARVARLRDRLEEKIFALVPGVERNGQARNRLPNTTNLRFQGISGEAMVIALDLRGFAVSSGSACSSGSVEPSHVLLAMGLTADEARSSVRISLGRDNQEPEVDALAEAVAECAAHLRRVSPVYCHA